MTETRVDRHRSFSIFSVSLPSQCFDDTPYPIVLEHPLIHSRMKNIAIIGAGAAGCFCAQ